MKNGNATRKETQISLAMHGVFSVAEFHLICVLIIASYLIHLHRYPETRARAPGSQ